MARFFVSKECYKNQIQSCRIISKSRGLIKNINKWVFNTIICVFDPNSLGVLKTCLNILKYLIFRHLGIRLDATKPPKITTQLNLFLRFSNSNKRTKQKTRFYILIFLHYNNFITSCFCCNSFVGFCFFFLSFLFAMQRVLSP